MAEQVDKHSGSEPAGPEKLSVPFEGYTPMPGVVPPVSAPQYQRDGDSSKCVVTTSRPVIPVPLVQEKRHKQTIVECDQVVVTDKVRSEIYTQDVYHEVPNIEASIHDVMIDIPHTVIRENPVVVELPTDINFCCEKVWTNRMVPRLFPKFSGKQDIIKIVLPKIEIVDSMEEKEVAVYVGEKEIEKEVVVERNNEQIVYEYVKKEVEVPVYCYKPVFDIVLDVPAPILVPVAQEPIDVDGGVDVIKYEEYRARKKRGARHISGRPVEALEPTEPPKTDF